MNSNVLSPPNYSDPDSRTNGFLLKCMGREEITKDYTSALMRGRRPSKEHRSSKPYARPNSSSQRRPGSLPSPLVLPKGEGLEGNSPIAGPSVIPQTVVQPSVPVNMPERPACLIRGSVLIEDHVEVPTLASTRTKILPAAHASTLGGKGVLQAVAISRAGFRAELVSGLGIDGEWVLNTLRSLGVGCGGCRVVDLQQDLPILCGRSLKQVTPNGESVSIVVPGANLKPVDPATETLLPPIKHVVLQNEIDRDITLEYIDIAHSRKLPVIVNPSPLPEDDEDLFSFPWDKASYIVLTEEEAASMARRIHTRVSSPGRRHSPSSAAPPGMDPLLRPSSSSLPPPSPPTTMHVDTRLASGIVPPIPSDAFDVLQTLMAWPILGGTGIVMKLNAPGGGALAVLPAARASNAKVYYEPAPPSQFGQHPVQVPLPTRALPLSDSRGCIDSMLGYFVAGLMEYALYDRMSIEDQTWKNILQKAVIASFMTALPRTIPPPSIIHSIPDFQSVQDAQTRLKRYYDRLQTSRTSLRPYPSQTSPGAGSSTSLERHSPSARSSPRGSTPQSSSHSPSTYYSPPTSQSFRPPHRS